MPRYFFDIRDHKGLHRDSDGVECDDLDDARKQAQTLVADVIREQMPDGDFHEVTCEVQDLSKQAAYRVKMTLQSETISAGGSTEVAQGIWTGRLSGFPA